MNLTCASTRPVFVTKSQVALRSGLLRATESRRAVADVGLGIRDWHKADDQKWKMDPNGYVLFCLCMGRFGNQIDHLLGGMAFAKQLNRTLLLPPFRTYKNVPFTEWFQLAPMQEFHRVMLAEDFMTHIAPHHWPPQERIGMCWLPEGTNSTECNMKKGSPFGPFWDDLGVDFERDHVYHISYSNIQQWKELYPPDKYPVYAFRGAPAPYPVHHKNRNLQRHLVFANSIKQEADDYIQKNFPQEKFIGIHLRTGSDFGQVCDKVDGHTDFMSSPQCLTGSGKKVTKEICYPSLEGILRLTKEIVQSTNIKVIFIATDKLSYKPQLEKHLAEEQVQVYHMDPWLPLLDLAVLIEADHFIGNCVSSFTAFVKRTRDLEEKPSSFWGFD